MSVFITERGNEGAVTGTHDPICLSQLRSAAAWTNLAMSDLSERFAKWALSWTSAGASHGWIQRLLQESQRRSRSLHQFHTLDRVQFRLHHRAIHLCRLLKTICSKRSRRKSHFVRFLLDVCWNGDEPILVCRWECPCSKHMMKQWSSASGGNHCRETRPAYPDNRQDHCRYQRGWVGCFALRDGVNAPNQESAKVMCGSCYPTKWIFRRFIASAKLTLRPICL